MVQSAEFTGWEWVSEFRLDYRDGQPGPYHGVIRAWSTLERPNMLVAAQAGLRQTLAERDAEIARLRALVNGYERGHFIRLMKWLDSLKIGGERGKD